MPLREETAIHSATPLPFFVTADCKELADGVCGVAWQEHCRFFGEGVYSPCFLEECENKWLIFLRVKKSGQVIENKWEILLLLLQKEGKSEEECVFFRGGLGELGANGEILTLLIVKGGVVGSRAD